MNKYGYSWTPRKHTVCNDGTTLSIQAGESLYCTPRGNYGEWTNVEVGFIMDSNGNQVTPPDSWKEYSDGEFPNDVYGYVPVALVEEFISIHGGRRNFV